MGLSFGHHDDVVFTRAPLELVLCQVKFPPVLSLMTAPGIAGFQDALIEEYPVLKPAERSAVVSVAGDNMDLSANPPIWKLTNDDETWTVSIASDFVALETPAYTDIDDFVVRLRLILAGLKRTIRPRTSTRIGLRKVNVLNFDGSETAELRGIVIPELLGPLAVEQFPAPIAGSSSVLEFVDDQSRMVIRYGLRRENDGPSGFLLDLDYFTTDGHEISGDSDLFALLRHFSEGMTSFFHWAIEDSYKQELDPRPRGRGQTR